jgi:hypothetical protein
VSDIGGEEETSMLERQLTKGLRLVAGLGVFSFALLFCGRVLYLALTEPYWKKLSLKQFPTMVGLPVSAIAALFLVLVLRAEAGEIEFKAVGFEFKGASGPIVMWALCFLVLTVAIRTLWIYPK